MAFGRGSGQAPGRPGPGAQRREGDWDCEQCGRMVWASKAECFSCGAPRPDGGAGRGAGGRGRGRGGGGEPRRPLPISRGPPAQGEADGQEDEQLTEALAQWFLSGEAGKRLQEHLVAAAASPSSEHGPSSEPGLRRRRPFVVSGMELFDGVPQAYPLLCSDWDRFNEVLHEAAQRARSKVAGGGPGKLYVRLSGVPGADFAIASVSQLRVSDSKRFTRVVGTVTRAGAAKVVQEFRTFRCEQCQHKFELRANPYSGYEFEVPKQCQSGAKTKNWDSNAKRAKTTKCNCGNFEPMPASEACMNDFQEIRVQDQMKALGPGVVPQSMAVVLFGDLIGRIQPGDTVSIEGVVHQRWKALWQGKRLEVELFLEATHVERISSESPVHNILSGPTVGSDEFVKLWALNRGNEWRVRQEIIKATAPWLNGMPVPKLALLLTLIGGSPIAAPGAGGEGGLGGAGREQRWNRFLPVEAEGPSSAGGWAPGAATGGGPAAGGEGGGAAKDQSHLRTTPHLLLLGDPGTGKSQLLQAAQELSARSVRTSGLGCTSAGLTCAAVRDGPDFVLEAGALVLADGGVCCIDEFSTIRSHDRAAVHEAMEQQTVSVAKAGLVTRLRSQCSVVAAQNCRKGPGLRSGRGAGYNRECSLAVNSGLPPPLLSRFDLVVVFSDDRQEADPARPGGHDLADFILGAGKPRPAPSAEQAKQGHNMVRSYIAWVKENNLTDAPDPRAINVIAAYFRKVRASASVSAGTFTVRFMESLLRLAQAHARLMNHTRVELEDAVAVILLHRAALQDHVVGADMGGDNEDFPASLPATHGEEMPACGVSLRMGGELNHHCDIADEDHYRRLEAKILGHLELQRSHDGTLAPLQRAEVVQLAPLADAPPGTQDVPPSQRPEEWPGSQLPAPDFKRGRRLGNYAPIKIEYAIDRYSMETKRLLDVLDKHLAAGGPYVCGEQYTIADMAIWPWLGNLVLGRLYGAAEFLQVEGYASVMAWAKRIAERPAVKRGRMVNRPFGEKSEQLHERHQRSDFETSTQDKIEAAKAAE